MKWRLITTWPKNLPGLGTGAQYFADQVTKCTGGRITVQLFASGEVVPAFESIDAVGSGTVEMGHGAPYYWKGKAPAAQFFSRGGFCPGHDVKRPPRVVRVLVGKNLRR